ncbi:MAG: hypothetical protein ACOCP8_02040 [archaeon]
MSIEEDINELYDKMEEVSKKVSNAEDLEVTGNINQKTATIFMILNSERRSLEKEYHADPQAEQMLKEIEHITFNVNGRFVKWKNDNVSSPIDTILKIQNDFKELVEDLENWKNNSDNSFSRACELVDFKEIIKKLKTLLNNISTLKEIYIKRN